MMIVGLVLRVVVMGFLYPQHLEPGLTNSLTDQDHFFYGFETGRIARSVATGHGFSSPMAEPTGPTAWLTPVYPLLLAAVFKIFGVYTNASVFAILIVNNLFSVLTCAPIYLLARRFAGEQLAFWSGWSWALFPWAVNLGNKWIWDLTLTTLLMAWLLVATIELAESGGKRAWLGYGALWGLAALTNPALLSVMPFLAAWCWSKQRERGHQSSSAVAFAACAFALWIAPWMMRNYRTFHTFVPLRSNFGLELYLGNSPGPQEAWKGWLHPSQSRVELDRMKQLGELAYMQEKQRLALNFMAENPGTTAVLMLRRIPCFWMFLWDLPPKTGLGEEFGVVNIVATSCLSFLAFWGLWRAVKQRHRYATPFAILFLFYPLVYYLTHADARYRHPIDPAVVVLAAAALVPLAAKVSDPLAEVRAEEEATPEESLITP